MQHIVCNAVCYCVCLGLCVILGVHNEGAGREVQAAGSSGGSNAEGPEIPSTAEGRHIEPTQHQHRPRPRYLGETETHRRSQG